jgi:Flp pilus assembly protein TadB
MRVAERTINAFGYIGLTVLVVLALLTWLGYIPEYLRLPVLFLALTLLLVRVTLRLLGERTKRLQDQADKKE